MKQQAWNIFRFVRGQERLVDTVYYDLDMDADQVERSEADHYGGNIKVRKPFQGWA